MKQIVKLIKPLIASFFLLGIGLLVSLIAVRLLGDSPLAVLQVLYKSAFGSREDIGMTLFYATPLIFTGLSVAVAFHAGLFNVGAEGQLTWGAMGVALTGILLTQTPAFIAPYLAAFVGFIFGAFWGFIPGWLRAFRGSHEVINTIMLNFIATGLTSYLVLYVVKGVENQSPETLPIAQAFKISPLVFFGDTPLNVSFFIALIFVVLVWLLLWKTTLGFEIRAVGQNEIAAKSQGINTARIQTFAMSLAGGIAGLVGINEVLGNAGKFKVGFSADYGFMGIAVALLARSHPVGVVFSALLFGALQKGAIDLDLETQKITRDFSLVLQALIIFAVITKGLWEKIPFVSRFLKESD